MGTFDATKQVVLVLTFTVAWINEPIALRIGPDTLPTAVDEGRHSGEHSRVWYCVIERTNKTYLFRSPRILLVRLLKPVDSLRGDQHERSQALQLIFPMSLLR